MKGKKDKVGSISLFMLAVVLIIWGIMMIVYNLVAVGVNSRTLSPSGFGGELLILLGLILLVVAYYSLSPFSKIRQFLEGDLKNRNKKKGN
ncbi:hypothetical protein [Pontibacter chinhatensis]|uniref:Uncharacterized protein n=1 Tax=Pontibacter chinhatensis TaxID=1436961 RepID=A0A1I2N8N5_9BACT|nr:hypothetical protein [Pontibacter chinhatensis]SFF99480.1 hypothetical protein SAMN05421739_101621 [Pontibacter chinhatensis]